MAKRPRIFAGTQLRQLRQKRAMAQIELADCLTISSSYLSQLEHDDRPLTPALAERLARLYPLDWQDFALDETEQLVDALREAAANPALGDPLPADVVAKIAEQQPELARRFIKLNALYRQTSQRLEMVDEAISVDGPIGSRLPWEEIRDWFHLSNNYVDELDRSAERLAQAIGGEPAALRIEDMSRHLADHHAVTVVTAQSETIRAFDAASRTLCIDAGQPASGIRFQLAYSLATCALGAAIDAIAAAAPLRTATARELLRVGLANYAAGALVMPYEKIRQLARACRHDVDRISHVFGTSFEQACHRLSTLQREGARGLPVFFYRVDMAGNITKRHSATPLQFARYGGACPLWIVHEAVAIPDRILVQLAETPDGTRYVSMAKGLVKSAGRFDRHPRRYAVALGCEARHAGEFVYADSIDASARGSATPIGASCRICPRTDCEHRAYPPSVRTILIDHSQRKIVPYEILE